MSFSLLFRRCAVATFLLLPSLAAFAQKVALKGDVITVDKKPYAKLKKSGSMLMRDYMLTTLDDKDVMLAKGTLTELPNNTTSVYYTLTFRPGGETAEMNKPGLSFNEQLAEALVQQGVMLDGQPDPAGIARFVKAYPPSISVQLAKDKAEQLGVPPLMYTTVPRSRNSTASIVMNRRLKRLEVVQSGTMVGYLHDMGTINDRSTWGVHLPDGTAIAEMSIESWMSGRDMTYALLTKRDNKYHNRSAVGAVAACQQDAIQYLVLGGLL